ncbi:Zn-ribbon domain-containing OB-fold protein [Chloroflexota bacterium]
MNEMPFTAASFDKFCSEKKLMASKCKQCGAVHLPPRPICMKCSSSEMEWAELKGKGKIVSFTVIGVGPWTMISEGYDREHPYCSGIVELEDGPRITTQILGVDVNKPENIKVGTPVTADFVERGSFSLVPEVANVRKSYLVFRAS